MFKIHSNLRSTLLLGAATAAAVSLSTAASAQGTVETVVVTGSRIPQQGLYSATPVTSIGQQEMQLQGTTSVETLLNNLPSVFGDQAGGVSNGSTGTATVNLRNLGSNRTLVLVDGKRLMSGDPNAAGSDTGAADLNFIPAALVDHVEVVTGGASTVYGSDAVAGVVNFIMRKDFEGVEIDAQGGIANHQNGDTVMQNNVKAAGFALPKSDVWDGENANLTMVMGANSADGKGNVTAYVGYRSERAVLESQRDFSACGTAVNYYSTPQFNSLYCAGSSTNPGGRFLSNDRTKTDPVYGTGKSLHSYEVTGTTIAPYSPAYSFNFAPYNYLQRPDTRYTAGEYSHYDFSSALQVYTSVMFMDDHSVAQIAPSGLFYGTAYNVNCDNPYLTQNPSLDNYLCGAGAVNPATATPLGPTDNASMLIGRRTIENGPRQDDLRHTDYRFVIGARGDLGHGVSYEMFAQYGTSIYAENFLNDLSISRAQNALQVVNVGGVPTCKAVVTGSDPTCVPLNLFVAGGPSAAALSYIKGNGFKEGSTAEKVVDANVTVDMGEWGVQLPWASSGVQFNVGAEYRGEDLTLKVDNEFLSGDLAGQGGPTPPVNGSFNVEEGFGEVRIPIVDNKPFFEDFTVNAGYRYSTYNVQGTASTYKYGFEWQSTDDIKFRGSYQRAVRAPNVNELFFPQSQGLWGGSDPCAGSSPTYTQAQCANTGVSAAQYGSVSQCSAAQCTALFGGNAALKPETADTWSIGAVLTPTFIQGFSATVDYYNIKVKGLVGVVPEKIILSQCATTGDPTFCGAIHRAAVSGIIFGQGPSAGYVTDLNINTGFEQVEGVDLNATYQADLAMVGLDDYGSMSFNFVGTYQPVNTTEPYTGGKAYDCAGLYGLVCGTPNPKWRHTLRVTWDSPWNFDISVAWRHMGSVAFDGNSTDPSLNDKQPFDIWDAKIGEYDYFDLAGEWEAREGLTFRFGIDNLFDRDPPIVDTNNLGISAPPFGNANTYPSVYDALGRTMFVSATVKF